MISEEPYVMLSHVPPNSHLQLLNMFPKCHLNLNTSLFMHILLFLFIFFTDNVENNGAMAQTIIKTLPGYNGTLPFKLETGYVGVSEADSVQLFYYFIESERNPKEDPLVVWLTGGPGCSVFSAIIFQNGPLTFDLQAQDGTFPSLTLNPYSYTKVANIIFLDLPVGTGFSYATTEKGYYSSDTKAARDAYEFLHKWLLNHPRFIKNSIYIAGDSYAGKLVPVITTEISRGNEAGLRVQMNLQGYFAGNPGANNFPKEEYESVSHAHRLALSSDEHYKLGKGRCYGEYMNPGLENEQCLYTLPHIDKCLREPGKEHVLEPLCQSTAPDGSILGKLLLEEAWCDINLPSESKKSWCRFHNYPPINTYTNDPIVREALHIREGTKGRWVRCNHSLSYDADVADAVPYHQFLSKRNYSALVYSGDKDCVVPFLFTLKWIRDLNLTIVDKWRSWHVDGEVVGYTKKYEENGFHLTFATVKGAGHSTPEYKPKECLVMIDKWFSGDPL